MHAKIRLLALFPKKAKTQIQIDTCALMFFAGLFTIYKIWKKPKCPLIDK